MRNCPENVVSMRRELAKIRKRIYMAALDMRYPLHERINSRKIDLTDMVGGFFSLNKCIIFHLDCLQRFVDVQML